MHASFVSGTALACAWRTGMARGGVVAPGCDLPPWRALPRHRLSHEQTHQAILSRPGGLRCCSSSFPVLIDSIGARTHASQSHAPVADTPPPAPRSCLNPAAPGCRREGATSDPCAACCACMLRVACCVLRVACCPHAFCVWLVCVYPACILLMLLCAYMQLSYGQDEPTTSTECKSFYYMPFLPASSSSPRKTHARGKPCPCLARVSNHVRVLLLDCFFTTFFRELDKLLPINTCTVVGVS